MTKYYVTTSHHGEFWYRNLGFICLHRVFGPAVSYYCGDVYWAQNDYFHRMSGPAVSISSGDEYWIRGIRYGKEEYDKVLRGNQSGW